MFEFVQLTDGTDSTAVEFTDMARYALVAYDFQVAPLSESDLGSDGPYADVTERITFHALGCTASEAYANAARVNLLLEQAWRWWYGEAVTSVRLQIRAQGSSTLVESRLKGRAPGSGPNIQLPATWSAYYGKYVIQDIVIQFVRDGRLLLPTADSTSVAAQPVPTVYTVAPANHTQLSPIRVDFTSVPASAGSTGIIAVTPASGQVIIEAESGSFGIDMASFNDSANSARGNNVARYTAPAVPLTSDITITITTINASARRFVALLALRKNTAADVFDVSLLWRKVDGIVAVVLATSETQRISSSNTNPQLILFDPITTRDQPNSLVITVQPITTAVGRTFDIDYLAIIQVDDNASAILSTSGGSFGVTTTISVDPLQAEPTPRVQVIAAGVNFPLTYTGNPTAFGMRGSAVWVTLFATGGISNPTRWRMYNTVGAAVAQPALTVTRQKAYLIPE